MSAPESILEGLNPEQRAAASTIDGPVLVLAGAGTGKTRVITVRIAHMLAKGIEPQHILGMTFTNKAAREMRERLAALVDPEQARKVTLGTFHSFCVRVLRRDIGMLGYLPSFTIADEADQIGLIKQAAGQLGFNKEEFPIPTALQFIGRWKNRLDLPEDVNSSSFSEMEVGMLGIYSEYQRLLELQNVVDFDDLLLLTWRLFDRHPEVLTRYQELYRYILVDEYQDTNLAQFAIIRQLAGTRCNLCVVGDDDQSIYGWRGADVGNILDFPKMFPGCKDVKLEQNYRSTNAILQAANAVIAGNAKRFHKNLWSALGEGDQIKVVKTADGESEAQFIADYIKQTMHEQPQLRYKDFAILYRSNNLSRQFEETLRRSMIPYKLVGGQEFFKRKEIKDAVSYLKLLVNPADDQSLLRILGTPPRGLADKAVEMLKQLKGAYHKPMTELLRHEEFHAGVSAAASKSARTLGYQLIDWRKEFESTPGGLALRVERYLNEVGYLDGLQKIYKDREDAVKRRENLGEFINAIAIYERKAEKPPFLAEYLENFALLEENDRTDEEANEGDAVVMSTVHASKGLEFGNVFLVALEEGIFPHDRAKNEGTVDEELRLFYVAITRAKRNLVILRASSRLHHGRAYIQRPSSFLEYLPEELLAIGEDLDFVRPPSVDELKAGLKNILDMLKKK